MSARYAPDTDSTWVVVLAGGDGNRVGALLRGQDGAPVPKQYFGFGERGTMCGWALARASALVPPGRILAVVAEHHREWWREALAGLPSQNILVQPENRGTGVGILLALARVASLAGHGQARVLFLPSDHYVAAEPVLSRTLVRTLESTGEGRLVLVGMAPEWADPEYGWIVPDGPSLPVARVARFVEKPDCRTFWELRRAGALINSFIFAAEVGALLSAFDAAAPRTLAALGTPAAAQAGSGDLRSVYRRLDVVDFSHDVLTVLPERLAVVAAPPCGWSDLGTPARLVHFLGQSGPASRERPRAVVRTAPSARPEVGESESLMLSGASHGREETRQC